MFTEANTTADNTIENSQPLTAAELAQEVEAMGALFAKLAPRTLLNPQPAIEAARTKIMEAGGALVAEGKTWVHTAADGTETRMTGAEFASWRTTL